MAASSQDAFIWAISQQESGGNYKAVGPNINGDHAYGKYQVMGSNIASWTKEALGHSLTIQQWLNDPGAQEQTIAHKLGGYYAKYGAAGAAAMWYSGQPDPNKTYGNPPVYQYVRSVLALMGRAPANAGSGLPKDTGGSAGDSSGGTATATQASYQDNPKCLVGFDIPLVGGVCLLTKGQARAIEGALLLIAGGIVAAGGLIILSAYGLKATGVLGSVASAAQVIPGAGGIAARAASASGALSAGPKPRPKGGSDGN